MTVFPTTEKDRTLEISVRARVPGTQIPETVLATAGYTLGNLVDRGLATDEQPGVSALISLPSFPAGPDAQRALVRLLLDMASELAAKTGDAQVLQVRRVVEAFSWQQPGFQDVLWEGMRGDLLNEMIKTGRFPTQSPTAEVALLEAGKAQQDVMVPPGIFGDAVVVTLSVPVL